MKRALLTAAAVVLSVVGLVASASAGQKDRDRDNDNSDNNGNFQKYVQSQGSNFPSKLNFVQRLSQPQAQNNQNIRPSWKANGDSFGTSNGNANPKKHGKKHQQQMQLDPGRPDGRVQVADVAAPVETLPPSYTRPGYVFVNDHWERIKANGTSVSTPGAPTGVTVQVNDHRAVPPPAYGRGEAGYGSHNVPVVPKDSNGVTVTNPGGPSRAIIGTGLGPVSVWNAMKALAEGPGFEAREPTNRDHRTPSKKGK